MEPFFSEEQLNNMSRENLIELMKIMKDQTIKKDTGIQLLKDKQKELEFINAMLSDRLALALARQEREFARYGLNLSTKTMANWITGCADRYLKLL